MTIKFGFALPGDVLCRGCRPLPEFGKILSLMHITDIGLLRKRQITNNPGVN